MPELSKTLWIIGRVLLPLLVGASLIVLVATRLKEPDPHEAASVVAREYYRPGDLVLLFPESENLELFRYEGMSAIASNRVPVGLSRYRRVILVHPAGPTSPIRRMLGAKASLLTSRETGGMYVDVFQIDETESVVVDLAELLPAATVAVRAQDGTESSCPWNADRFDCGDAEWTWVGMTTQVLGGEPYRCIWSHPIEDATLVIQFKDLPRADALVGWIGLTDYAVSIGDASPVNFELRAGGKTDRTRVHKQQGRRPISFDLPDTATTDLEIRLSAPSAGVRHICWDLQAVNLARLEHVPAEWERPTHGTSAHGSGDGSGDGSGGPRPLSPGIEGSGDDAEKPLLEPIEPSPRLPFADPDAPAVPSENLRPPVPPSRARPRARPNGGEPAPVVQ